MNAMNQDDYDNYISSLKSRSDRELLEVQTYYAKKSAEYAKSSNNYHFRIFFLMLLVALIVLLVTVSKYAS